VLDTDVKLILNKEIIEKITNIKLENPSISYLTFPSSLESLFNTYGYLKRGYILNKYKVIAHLHNGKLSKKTFSLELSDLEMCDVVLILSSYVPRGKYLEFLKDKYPYKTIFFVKYLHDTPLYSKSFYTNKE